MINRDRKKDRKKEEKKKKIIYKLKGNKKK